MAAFSRGRTLLQLPHTLRSLTLCTSPIHQPGALSPLLRRCFASKAPLKPITQKGTTRAPIAVGRAPYPKTQTTHHLDATKSAADRIDALPPSAINPTTINLILTGPEPWYQAPSFKSYIGAAYGLGTFFLLYGGYAVTLSAVGVPPEGIPAWVTAAYGFSAGALACVGLWSILSSTYLLRRIVAIPNPKGELILRFTVSKWVPWRRHTFEAPVSKCFLKRGVLDKLLRLGHKREKKPLDQITVFWRPWVWIGRGIFNFFVQTRSMFFREHMVAIGIEGKGNYQLDVRGMALGGAESLDQLIPALE